MCQLMHACIHALYYTLSVPKYKRIWTDETFSSRRNLDVFPHQISLYQKVQSDASKIAYILEWREQDMKKNSYALYFGMREQQFSSGLNTRFYREYGQERVGFCKQYRLIYFSTEISHKIRLIHMYMRCFLKIDLE